MKNLILALTLLCSMAVSQMSYYGSGYLPMSVSGTPRIGGEVNLHVHVHIPTKMHRIIFGMGPWIDIKVCRETLYVIPMCYVDHEQGIYQLQIPNIPWFIGQEVNVQWWGMTKWDCGSSSLMSSNAVKIKFMRQ